MKIYVAGAMKLLHNIITQCNCPCGQPSNCGLIANPYIPITTYTVPYSSFGLALYCQLIADPRIRACTVLFTSL